MKKLIILEQTVPWPTALPQNHEFSRKIWHDTYKDTNAKLTKNNFKKILEEADQQINNSDFGQVSMACMKYLACADFLLANYCEEKRRTISEYDIPRLREISNLYHFAGNGLRRLSQYDISAELYHASGSLGCAVIAYLKTEKGNVEFNNKEIKPKFSNFLDFCDRSYTRAMATYKQTGSYRLSDEVYVELHDFRKNRYQLEGYYVRSVMFFIWGTSSKYGTELRRLFWIGIASLIVLSIFRISLFAIPKTDWLNAVADTLSLLISTSIASGNFGTGYLLWFNLFNLFCGVVLIALIINLIMNKTLKS